MNSDELARAMALLAAEHRRASAPVSVERAVLARFDASRRRRAWGIAAAAAIAATLAASAILIRERPAPLSSAMAPTVAASATPRRFEAPAVVIASKPVVQKRTRRRAAAPQPNSEEQPFIAIPYTVPLAPGENATVVRMTLSPSALAVAGFPLPAIDPGGATEADVLVSEDGRARAIRIVANSNFR